MHILHFYFVWQSYSYFACFILQKEDIERTLGIDTLYVQTTDFDLEEEDKDFLVQVSSNRLGSHSWFLFYCGLFFLIFVLLFACFSLCLLNNMAVKAKNSSILHCSLKQTNNHILQNTSAKCETFFEEDNLTEQNYSSKCRHQVQVQANFFQFIILLPHLLPLTLKE